MGKGEWLPKIRGINCISAYVIGLQLPSSLTFGHAGWGGWELEVRSTQSQLSLAQSISNITSRNIQQVISRLNQLNFVPTETNGTQVKSWLLCPINFNRAQLAQSGSNTGGGQMEKKRAECSCTFKNCAKEGSYLLFSTTIKQGTWGHPNVVGLHLPSVPASVANGQG